MSLSCIVCDKELEDAIPGTEDQPVTNQPHKGTTFISHGQYGSTVWDYEGWHGAFLEVNICDDCLVAKHGKVLKATPIVKPSRENLTYEIWDFHKP